MHYFRIYVLVHKWKRFMPNILLFNIILKEIAYICEVKFRQDLPHALLVMTG